MYKKQMLTLMISNKKFPEPPPDPPLCPSPLPPPKLKNLKKIHNY